MSKILRISAVALVLVAMASTLATAASKKFKVPGFTGNFSANSDPAGNPKWDVNQKGGFTMVQDPLDPSNTKKVFKFSIKAAPCIKGDCDSQSARTTVEQLGNQKQPKEAWYGWDIYFPEDFPYSVNQTKGHQIFTEFKDQRQCQLVALTTDPSHSDQFLSWGMSRPTGEAYGDPKGASGGDCKPVFKKPIARFQDIVGAWHRYELFARWSKQNDGKFLIYLDGKLVLEYDGVTCFNCDKLNYFLFGNYLCCTPDTTTIKAATVFYRNISSAKSREALLWK